MKTITIKEISQEVFIGSVERTGPIATCDKRTRVRRPGLEFMDKFDFMGMEYILVLGKNEVNYCRR